jgi:hypothetical protein
MWMNALCYLFSVYLKHIMNCIGYVATQDRVIEWWIGKGMEGNWS